MIHDLYFSTPPKTFTELRWRMQFIAEEEMGKYMRRAQSAEELAAREMVSRLGSE